ncbi:ureidoglycolate lyase [Roseofilum sp. BLCC_M91]|uniref:Ureidoglycolate lyase n=1 Tax=Roseofilum halophilum BLCC-M91 TaxID=3022259 RepID=A0ABT7BM42_9CYAN|nr:ureidoglycolate lyase [Roseofilum halophilum]MDJ1179348.1 ureidoglycolate lyase [Roseofilum halophilum BLCC-M91]
MTEPLKLQPLPAPWIAPETFAPYGQVIWATDDGKPYDSQDAQLILDRGTPRFYIMRLHQNGRKFAAITRHQNCTQCLGSLEGKDWFLGVAPPSENSKPDPEQIRAFHIPGNCFVKLHLGTWHAGPHIDHDFVDFYNLELSDTNITDHQTCNLGLTYGLEFEISDRRS